MDAKTGKGSLLSQATAKDGFTRPAFSPDGEFVVFSVGPADRFARATAVPSDPSVDAATRITVIDRTGGVVFETSGTMPDWMPAWP